MASQDNLHNTLAPKIHQKETILGFDLELIQIGNNALIMEDTGSIVDESLENDVIWRFRKVSLD